MHLTPLEYIVTLSTLLELNPLFQAIKSVKNKNAKGVSLATFVFIMSIGIIWLYYGITISSIPLILGNSIKLFTALVVVIILIKYKKEYA